MKFIDSRGGLTEAEVWEVLAKHIAIQREHGIQYWPVFLLDSGEHVGCCGLRPYDTRQRIYELGAHIRPKWWRHGFALEAATVVIEYAFRALGATALFAGHNPNNGPSRGLLEKLGFQHTHDEFYAPTGLQHPSYMLMPKTGSLG